MLRRLKNILRISEASQSGVTMVEFALVLPLFLLILGGITDLGVAVFLSHNMTNTSREAARAASAMESFSTEELASLQGILRDELANINAFRNFDVDFSTPYDPADDGVTQQYVRINIHGTYPTYFLRLIGISQIDLAREQTVRYEHQVESAPPPPAGGIAWNVDGDIWTGTKEPTCDPATDLACAGCDVMKDPSCSALVSPGTGEEVGPEIPGTLPQYPEDEAFLQCYPYTTVWCPEYETVYRSIWSTPEVIGVPSDGTDYVAVY